MASTTCRSAQLPTTWARPTPTTTLPRPGFQPPRRRTSPGPPKTTTDHFRDPPPSRIMDPWRAQGARAICTLPGHRSSRRHEARYRSQSSGSQPSVVGRRPPRHPPGTPRMARTSRPSHRDHRTGVRVADVSRSSRVDIEQPRWSRSQPYIDGQADHGKEHLVNAALGKHDAHIETRRPTSLRPTGRTRSTTMPKTVRAFGQKCVSRRSDGIQGGK